MMLIALGVMFLVVFTSFILYVVWRGQTYHKSCLKEVAEDYCLENNMTFHRLHNPQNFYCILESNDLRTEPKPQFKFNYFLEDELEGCIKRKAKSWRKINYN